MRYVVAVAETGSLSAGARASGVSQPALSKSISRLEDHLGTPLFERTSQGARLTSFGHSVLPYAKSATSATDSIISLAAKLESKQDRTIRLGVSPVVNPRIVSKIFEAARDLPTDIEAPKLVVAEENLAVLQEELKRNKLDIILVPAVASMPGFKRALVDWEPLVVVDSKTDSPQDVDVSDLASDPLILATDACGLTWYTRELMEDHQVSPEIYPGEALSYAVLEQWARMGLGNAVLPQAKISAGHTGSRLMDHGQPVEIFYEAIWNPRSPLASLIEKVVGAISKQDA